MTLQDMSAEIRVNNLFTSLNFHTIFDFCRCAIKFNFMYRNLNFNFWWIEIMPLYFCYGQELAFTLFFFSNKYNGTTLNQWENKDKENENELSCNFVIFIGIFSNLQHSTYVHHDFEYIAQFNLMLSSKQSYFTNPYTIVSICCYFIRST